MTTYRYEVAGRQVEGLSDGDRHFIFSHLLFPREVKDSSDGRVLTEKQTAVRWAERSPPDAHLSL